MKIRFLIPFFLFLSVDSFSLNRRVLLNNAVSSYSLNQIVNSKTLINTNDIKNNIIQMNNSPNKEELTIMQESNNDIYLYGQISQRSCFELKKLLTDMDIKMKKIEIEYKIKAPPIHLHLQSEGGSLYHTLYIIDLIQSLNSDVYTYVDGFAASAATLISVVGKKRFMTNNSLMLIHQLSGSDSGKFNELQDQMNNMSVLMSIIVNIYLKYTKLDKELLNDLLKKDLWLDSETCLKYGLVDEIL